MTEALEDIDVDALVAESHAIKDVRPMGEEPASPEAKTEPAVNSWDGKAWEFDWNGKKVFPDSQDKAKTWMSQGYNYSQRVAELNKQKAAWDTERTELTGFKDKFGQYSKVDEYAAKNPEWWKHVEESWASREIPKGLDPNLASVLTPIQQQLAEIKQERELERQMREQEKLQETIKKDDETLSNDIAEAAKAYPQFDFASKDETGKTLEYRILAHAQEIGTSSFRAALRDYLHDQLVTTAKANGREALTKDTQLNAKKGLLGTTQAPLKGFQKAENVRNKSYADLANEAKREYGVI